MPLQPSAVPLYQKQPFLPVTHLRVQPHKHPFKVLKIQMNNNRSKAKKNSQNSKKEKGKERSNQNRQRIEKNWQPTVGVLNPASGLPIMSVFDPNAINEFDDVVPMPLSSRNSYTENNLQNNHKAPQYSTTAARIPISHTNNHNNHNNRTSNAVHGNPLPNHEFSPKKFNLVRVHPGISSSCLKYDKLFKCCGEDIDNYADFRQKMFRWYFITIYNATKSPLLYHGMLSHSGYIMLNRVTRPYSRGKYPAKHVSIVAQHSAYNRGLGLQLAQKTIGRINMPQYLLGKDYLKLVCDIISYSSINIALTFFADKDYSTLLAFMDGFISVLLVRQLIEKFIESMAQVKHIDRQFYEEKLLYQDLFSVVQSFFLCNINTIYFPNYNSDVIAELYHDLLDYSTILKQHLNEVKFPDVAAQTDELSFFIKQEILDQLPWLNNHQDFVSQTEPRRIFTLLRKFLMAYPSECAFFSSTQASHSIFEKIAYLYWLTCASVLNIMFNESTYLFMCRFEGVILFSGFDSRLYQSIFHELDTVWKAKDLKLYDQLYRHTIYLSRVTSFTRYRWRTYWRNLKILDHYPDNEIFDKARLKPRKVKFIEEKQVHSFKKTRIKYENYPRVDENKLGMSSEANRDNDFLPHGTKMATFYNTNFQTNVHFSDNVDKRAAIEGYFEQQCQKHQSAQNRNGNGNNIENNSENSKSNGKGKGSGRNKSSNGDNYNDNDNSNNNDIDFDLDTIPTDLLELSEYGLLLDIDFRPQLANMGNIPAIGADFFQNNERTLSTYSSDRCNILDHKLVIGGWNDGS